MTDSGAGQGGAPLRVWLLLGAGLLSLGGSAILIRYAGDVPPVAVAAWRTIFVTLVLAPWAAHVAYDEILAFSPRDWLLIGSSGVLLGAHFVAWIASVTLTSVASASVLVTMSPVFIAGLGALFLRERPTWRVGVGIAVAVAGAALIAVGEQGGGGARPNPALGNALAVGAALLVSVYLLIGRAVRQRTSFLAYFVPVNAVAAATTVAACLLTGTPLALPLPALLICLTIALGPGLLGHGSFTVALGYLPAAFVGLLTLAEPVLASGLALVLFDEVPTPLSLAGAVIVIVAIGAVIVAQSVGGDESNPSAGTSEK